MSGGLRTISPYIVGYLSATGAGTRQQDGGIVCMPHRVYDGDPYAEEAFLVGMADSIEDRRPRRPTDRVSRAHPPWRLL